MPCSSPLQGVFVPIITKSGVISRKFLPNKKLIHAFKSGKSLPELYAGEHEIGTTPCGKCMYCRLEKSRQTALRCVHEARMFEDSCFVTLTFSEDMMKKLCPLTEGGYSLVRKHTQDFAKRLREKFARGFTWKDKRGNEYFYQSDKVRIFGCGEYGDESGRPHYHFCLFNCAFPDRVYYATVNGHKYYNSPVLDKLWSVDDEVIGHAVIGDFSFETAAYVARYVTKKINGPAADKHYKGRLPEFSVYPTRGGGLGKDWFEKFAESDIYPTDTCVVRGKQCSVPRYYDRLRERDDPDGLKKAKDIRIARAKSKSDDNTYERLRTKEKCMNARIKLLIRRLEKSK